MIVFTIRNRVKDKCVELFPKYWTESHLLMGNRVYVYKEEYISSENLYQKKQMMNFINDLGYFGGGVPSEEADQKHLKCLIDTQLLVEAYTWEERKIIFGKFVAYLISIFLLLIYLY